MREDFVKYLDVDGRRDDDESPTITKMLKTITGGQVLEEPWKTTYDDVFHHGQVAEVFEMFDDRNSAEDIMRKVVDQECGEHFMSASDELLAKIYLQIMFEIPLPEESDGVRRMQSHMKMLLVLMCQYGDWGEEGLRQRVDVTIDRYVFWATLAPNKGGDRSAIAVGSRVSIHGW